MTPAYPVYGQQWLFGACRSQELWCHRGWNPTYLNFMTYLTDFFIASVISSYIIYWNIVHLYFCPQDVLSRFHAKFCPSKHLQPQPKLLGFRKPTVRLGDHQLLQPVGEGH